MPRSLSEKILSWEDLPSLCRALHDQKKKIVTTNGCFDLLHLGHLLYLEKARQQGDVLLCAVNSDASVRRLKGESRPIHSERIRAQQVAALESVDYVVIFSQNTPKEFLEIVRPSIHVKGGDYRPEDLPEKSIVEACGGSIFLVPYVDGFSTTALLKETKT